MLTVLNMAGQGLRFWWKGARGETTVKSHFNGAIVLLPISLDFLLLKE